MAIDSSARELGRLAGWGFEWWAREAPVFARRRTFPGRAWLERRVPRELLRKGVSASKWPRLLRLKPAAFTRSRLRPPIHSRKNKRSSEEWLKLQGRATHESFRCEPHIATRCGS